MIIPDNYIIVERPDGTMIEDHSFEPWTEDNDNAARYAGGKIIKVNSDPAEILIDYGTAAGRMDEIIEELHDLPSVKMIRSGEVPYTAVVLYHDGKKYEITMREVT